MRTRSITVFLFLLAVIGSGSGNQVRTFAGNMLGVNLYWQHETLTFDTLRWGTILKRYTPLPDSMRSPNASQALLRKENVRVLRIREASAISTAILLDLGFDVVVLSQWNGMSEAQFRVVASGHPTDARKQRLMSDYLWERVVRYDAERPSGLRDDFTLRFYFDNEGYSPYNGKEDINRSFQQVMGTTDGVIVTFDNNSTAAQDIRRRIHDSYIVTDLNTSPLEIVRKVEKQMDSLKLDMSYKPPVIVELE